MSAAELWRTVPETGTRTPGRVLPPRALRHPGPPEPAARAFLAAHPDVFHIDPVLLDHLQTVEMGTLAHVRFQQHFHGVPVEGAQYVVSLRRDGSVALANGTLHPDAFVPTTTPAVSAATAREVAFELGRAPTPARDVGEELVVLPKVDGGPVATFRLVWKVRYRGEAPAYIDAMTGQRISPPIRVEAHRHTPANRASTPSSQGSSARNTGLSICGPPDPCGSVYLENPDSTPTRTIVPLSVLTNQSGVYNLQNGLYINASNVVGPQAAPANGSFVYPDTDPRFETVMAYHHATEFRLFLNSIGYNSNRTEKMLIETALSGDGAEYFPIIPQMPGDPTWKIELRRSPNGESPNAMAFEAKVVMHEYGHGVLDDLAKLIDNGPDEEGAITEGLPDYFAGAFTERPEILDWAAPQFRRNMAAPMGLHQGPPGNQNPITTYAAYSQSNNVESHRGGEFISFVLWTLRQSNAVPSGDFDRIVMATVPLLSTNVDFLELRNDMIVASEALFGTQYEQAILDGFAAKGIGVGIPPTGGSTNPSMYASITGPTCQDPSQPATFHRGTYGGGTDPHITTWRWRRYCGLSATPCGVWNSGTQGTSSYTISRDEDYEVMLDVFDANGDTGYSNIIAVDFRTSGCSQGAARTNSGKTGQPVGVGESSALASTSAAAESPPHLVSANPTRSRAEVAFSTPGSSEVTVSVVDVLGRYIVTPSTASYSAGAHSQSVDLSAATPGVYVIRVAVEQDGAAPAVSALPVTVIR